MTDLPPATARLRPGLTLYLIRHGETDWNREARYQGQRDIPMNASGRDQARRHGEVLRTLLPEIAAYDFVSSPLQRARESTVILRTALDLDPNAFRIDPDLAELSYGHWEGELASELQLKDPEGIAGKAADPFGWRPNGGESYRDLQARIAGWLEKLQTDTVAVTHGGVSRVARGALFGIEPRVVPFLAVPQDKILKISGGEMQWL